MIAIVNDGVVLQSQLDDQIDMVIGAACADQKARSCRRPTWSASRCSSAWCCRRSSCSAPTRLGVQVSDEMLNEALRDVAKRNDLPFEQMPAALASQGVDYASYRDDMRREIMLTLLRQRDVYPRIYVSPRELDQALERQCDAGGRRTRSSTSPTSCCRCPSPRPTEQMARVEKLAHEIHDRAKQGEDFGQLALAYSQAQSALERGKLGWRRLNQLPQFIADLVAGMKPGEVANPVRTPTGFHIVRLDDTRGASTGPMLVEQIHARHILMRPNEVQDDATTRQRLAALRDRILAGEDFGALASVTSEDPASASHGGDLGWTFAGHLRPRVRDRARRARAEPDQRAIPHPVRLAHRPDAGQAHIDQSDDVRRQRVLTALAREQGRRGDRAVAATTPRRGLRRDPQPLNRQPRLIVTTGEPAGIGPDLALAAALRDWPCELVFAGDPALLAARARAARSSRSNPRSGGRTQRHRRIAPERCRWLPSRSRPQVEAGQARSSPMRAMCSRCSMRRPTAASPGSSRRW